MAGAVGAPLVKGSGWRPGAGLIAGLVLATLTLTGCAPRPGAEMLDPVAVAPERVQRVFVKTTREARKTPTGVAFTDGRAETSRYMVYDFSIPPTHRSSEIEWPKTGGTPDPATDFVVTSGRETARPDFLQAVRGQGRGRQDVSLFIHGYNTSMPEAVFRAAQIATDADTGGAAVLFAWPSSANTMAYVADRDAADFSRPALTGLVEDLARTPGIGRIFIIGHSMGGRLTMESLLQLRLKGRRDILRRVEVVLADPDIDIDLFWQQSAQIGPLPVPITVLTATDDKALQISKTLAGGRVRIGGLNIRDPEVQAQAKAHGVRLIDVSDMDTDLMAHGRLMQIAAMYEQVPASRPGAGLRRAGAFMVRSAGQGMIAVGDAFAH